MFKANYASLFLKFELIIEKYELVPTNITPFWVRATEWLN
jgi:hypothetical protein